MTVLNPIEFSDAYDVLAFEDGTITSPGKVTISGLSRDEAWDVKDGNGVGGASITRKGEKLCKFTATFELADVEDFEEWDTFLPYLKSCTASKTPKALPVTHPDVTMLDVDKVVVESIGQLQHDGRGGAKVDVKFIEYRPPKPKGGAPKNSKADPNADVKAENAALRAEAMKP